MHIILVTSVSYSNNKQTILIDYIVHLLDKYIKIYKMQDICYIKNLISSSHQEQSNLIVDTVSQIQATISTLFI